jgi:hypothetical protein
VKVWRGIFSFSAAAVAVAHIGFWFAAESRAQTPDRTSISGAWTLNTELSDKPPERGERGGREGDDGNHRGGGGGMGGGFGGGMRGMGRGGGSGAGGGRANPDDVARMRDAMRAVTTAPERLTITQTETMVLMTSQDGHTTRISPDGKKIKDENTGVERKSRWDGARLVSEISGLGPGKITETYWVDDDHHRLHVAVQMAGGRGQKEPVTTNRVYDAEAR